MMAHEETPSATTPLLRAGSVQRHHDRSRRHSSTGVSGLKRVSDAETEDQTNEPETPNSGLKVWRLLATFFSFIVVGGIDGAYGVLVHYFGEYYHADYLAVSVVLLSPVAGYIIAAFANNAVHSHLGQRGIAILGPGLHLVAFLAAAQHPPYPILVIVCMFAGLGSGLLDAGWNAWIGAMDNSNGFMGALHAFYGIGAALTPLVAQSVVDRLGWQWYHFYYLMAAVAVVELCTSTAAFWKATGAVYRETHQSLDDADADGPAGGQAMKQALGKSSTWIVSFFIFFYAGIEISLADWILSLLVDARHNSPFAGSMVTFGYWGGLTFGRVIIGFITAALKTGKKTVTVCLVLTITMHFLFVYIPSITASAVVLPVLGFFLGPLFPEAVIMQTKLLDKNLHVAAVGFSCALGSAGGCVCPFIIGAIAKPKGIEVLQPAVLVMLLLNLGLWLALPHPPNNEGSLK